MRPFLHWCKERLVQMACPRWKAPSSHLPCGQRRTEEADWREIGGSLWIFALWINSRWPTWAVIEEFFIQLAPTIPWWAWACYFLMKPFSQPVVEGVSNRSEWGFLFFLLFLFQFFLSNFLVLFVLQNCFEPASCCRVYFVANSRRTLTKDKNNVR